jgi:hypothetical protein
LRVFFIGGSFLYAARSFDRDEGDRHFNFYKIRDIPWECIFFDQERVDENTLESLALAREKHPSRYKKEVAKSAMIKRGDGQVSQFVVVNDIDVRVGAKLSFVRTLDGHSYENYEGPSVPIRSEKQMEFAHFYGKKLEEEAERRKKSSATNDGPNTGLTESLLDSQRTTMPR